MKTRNTVLFLFVALALVLSACAPVNLDVGNFHMSWGDPQTEEVSTVEPAADQVDEDATDVVLNGNPMYRNALFTGNVLLRVDPVKKNPNGCGGEVPEEACNVLDPEGVLGVDNYAELYNDDGTKKNNSGVWTGSADHQTAQTAEVGVIIPEGSYISAYATSLTIDGGGYHLVFPECGEHCSWGFIARGLTPEEHADRNLAVVISKYGAIGAMKYTRYPVPVEHAQYFSKGYALDQAYNALKFDNCGIGARDCDEIRYAIFDYQDGSLTIFSVTRDGIELLWSNVALQ